MTHSVTNWLKSCPGDSLLILGYEGSKYCLTGDFNHIHIVDERDKPPIEDTQKIQTEWITYRLPWKISVILCLQDLDNTYPKQYVEKIFTSSSVQIISVKEGLRHLINITGRKPNEYIIEGKRTIGLFGINF